MCIRDSTHLCTLIELLSLNCTFFSPELMPMSLLIHWSVYEQQQRVVNVSETFVDIYNCKATHSLVYFNWTAFFKLYLFLTGAYAHVPSDPLNCVWAAAEGENVSEAVVDIYNCKATHSLTHSYLDETAFFALCLLQCFIVVGITAILSSEVVGVHIFSCFPFPLLLPPGFNKSFTCCWTFHWLLIPSIANSK